MAAAKYPTNARPARSPKAPSIPRVPRAPAKPANDNVPFPDNDNEKSRAARRYRSPMARAYAGIGPMASRFAIGGYALGVAADLYADTLNQYSHRAKQYASWALRCKNGLNNPFRQIEAPGFGGCPVPDPSYQFIHGETLPNSTHTRFNIFGKNGAGFSTGRHLETWDLVGPWTQPGNFRTPKFVPNAPLEVPQWADPFSKPVGAPEIAPPRPAPYRVQPNRQPNPWRDPWEQPHRRSWPEIRPGTRPGTNPRVKPRPATSPRPGVVETPNENPDLPPTVSVNPSAPGYGVAASPAPGAAGRPPRGEPPHRSRRPEKDKEKDRKFVANAPKKGGLGAIAGIAGAVTEGVDAVDAIWDAMPPWSKTMVKGKKTSPQQKAKDIWDNFGAADIPKALENILKEQAKDALYGRAGRAAGKPPVGSGRPVGNTTGPAL